MLSLLSLRFRKVVAAMGSREGIRALVRHRVVSTIEHGHLRRLQVRTVLDVGANRGQFALFAAKAFPGARIISFEPGKEAFEVLKDVTSTLENVQCHELALGDASKTATLSITRDDDSSSLLVPAVETQADARGLEVVDFSEVAVKRLDQGIKNDDLEPPTLLKIDVQGTELDVLRGAEGLLPRIDYVYVEVSFIQLYEGQSLAEEVAAHLRSAGFVLQGMFNPSTHQSGQLIQCDALFARPA